jgi:GT2 family glycosyltransferase
MPRATIALLNWNGGDFVVPCVTSLLSQTERSIEIVVVDNGSTDGSCQAIAAVLKGSSVKHEVVRLGENLGICGGLQQALDRAQGDYFFPFASDDVMSVNRVKLQCDQLDTAPFGTNIAAGAVALVGPDGAPLLRSSGRQVVVRPARYGGWRRTRALARRPAVPPAPGMAFRTDAVRSIGGYDVVAPVEDVDLFMRLVLLGRSRVVTTQEIVVCYRRHGTNASTNRDLMAEGLVHTGRNLSNAGVDFGWRSRRWRRYLEAMTQGYRSPWGGLLDALRAEPFDQREARSAAIGVLRTPSVSISRRAKAGLAIVCPVYASRRVAGVAPRSRPS